MLKLCIVGSYSWKEEDIPKAKELIRQILVKAKVRFGTDLLVISGECHKGGVDIWARDEAITQQISFNGYPPISHTKGAYMARNRKMAQDCDVLVRIASSVSKTFGSGYTAKIARNLHKRVIEFTSFEDQILPW